MFSQLKGENGVYLVLLRRPLTLEQKSRRLLSTMRMASKCRYIQFSRLLDAFPSFPKEGNGGVHSRKPHNLAMQIFVAWSHYF